jgi:hypothetical protein
MPQTLEEELKRGKFIYRTAEVPSVEHWAILRNDSTTVPGDERSRQAPGHGYPEHTDTYMTYQAFTDKAVFEAELTRCMISKV